MFISHETVRGLIESHEDDVTEEGINYVAMRNLFVREAREAVEVKKVEKKTRTTHIREVAGRMELGKTVNPFDSFCEFVKTRNQTSLQMLMSFM